MENEKRERGRPTRYPGKNKNRALNLSMTDETRAHFDQQARNHGMSKADYISALVRGDVRQTKIEVGKRHASYRKIEIGR